MASPWSGEGAGRVGEVEGEGFPPGCFLFMAITRVSCRGAVGTTGLGRSQGRRRAGARSTGTRQNGRQREQRMAPGACRAGRVSLTPELSPVVKRRAPDHGVGKGGARRRARGPSPARQRSAQVRTALDAASQQDAADKKREGEKLPRATRVGRHTAGSNYGRNAVGTVHVSRLLPGRARGACRRRARRAGAAERLPPEIRVSVSHRPPHAAGFFRPPGPAATRVPLGGGSVSSTPRGGSRTYRSARPTGGTKGGKIG